MRETRKTVKIKVRESSAREDLRRFQAEIVPNAVFEGRELWERFAAFLGLPFDKAHQAKTRITEIEDFILSELERGNRLDFGLVSFFPKLSAALPERDADPTAVGVHVRGAVKSRRSLSAPLDKYLVAENPTATETSRILNVIIEGDRTPSRGVDRITDGKVLSALCKDVTIDLSQPDEGIWLEKQAKRWHEQHLKVADCEYLRTDYDCLKFRLNEKVAPGKYMLTMGTRAGRGPDYKLRVVRHLVRVV